MKLHTLYMSTVLALSICLVGCGGDDDGTDDVGTNNPDIVACVGDSITQGYMCDGLPYPDRLAGMCGKSTINYGLGGMTSSYGVEIISSVLAKKPGYVCILFGSNDVIKGRDIEDFEANIRYIVQACKANSTIPVIATLPPMNKEHILFNGKAQKFSDVIVEIAKTENVRIADVRKEFGDGEQYINDDGLHLTDAGGELLATCFAKKI